MQRYCTQLQEQNGKMNDSDWALEDEEKEEEKIEKKPDI